MSNEAGASEVDAFTGSHVNGRPRIVHRDTATMEALSDESTRRFQHSSTTTAVRNRSRRKTQALSPGCARAM